MVTSPNDNHFSDFIVTHAYGEHFSVTSWQKKKCFNFVLVAENLSTYGDDWLLSLSLLG